MDAFKRGVILRVVGLHFVVVLVVVFSSFLKGCFKPKPKPEIVTFVEFGSPAPPVHIQEVATLPDPTPVEDIPPKPISESVPDPIPIPEPVKKKIVKPKVDKPKDPIKKPKPPKKQWKPAKVEDIKIGKKVSFKETKPAVSRKDISNALNFKSSVEKSGPVGNPSADGAYIAKIGNYLDRYWTAPASASSALVAVVRIDISKSGAITGRTKIQRSGDAAFDQSVMAAVNAVKSVPPPPSSFSYDYVEVEFRIRN